MRARVLMGLISVMAASGCVYIEDEQLDDLFDGAPQTAAPLSDATDNQLEAFAQGRNLFQKQWSPQVVGPIFNAPACGECHVDQGRAAAQSVGVLFRLSDATGHEHPIYGGQLQPLGLRQAPGEGAVATRYDEVAYSYPDGTPYSLRVPRYQLVRLAYGPAEDAVISPRIAQQLWGIGLLEAIRESEIVALQDPEDADGDGISGRANLVPDAATGRTVLGRFGWKAGQPSLRQQNAAAFAGDLGITSSLFRQGPCQPGQNLCNDAMFDDVIELDDTDLDHVTTFVQMLAPMPASESAVADLFEQLQCSGCHVPEYVTGTHDVQALSGRTIRPYTDLLLHDMGDGLADNRAEEGASGREWRTPPLWGIGRVRDTNGHMDLLHDGRARGVAEAILWHGGEGEQSARRFAALSAEERARLVAFVESL
ncbi:MAG: di-heme oxidoredictase family protein [bacterium]